MVTIFGIKINNRQDDVSNCQRILTKYGCNIKTRIGLHNFQGDICSEHGIILLEMCNNEKDNNSMWQEFEKMKNIKIVKMEL